MIVRLTLFLLLVASFAVPLQAKPPVAAHWNDGAIRIDGDIEDWDGRLRPIGRSNLRVGVRNDDEFLYVALVMNRGVEGRRALERGITLELGKRVKVQFPVGLGTEGGPSLRWRELRDPAQREQAIEESMDVMIVHGDSDRRGGERFRPGSVFGIDARIVTQPRFVYELKVPLRQTEVTPYAVDARPGDRLIIRAGGPPLAAPEVEVPGSSIDGATGGIGGTPGLTRGGFDGTGPAGGRGGSDPYSGVPDARRPDPVAFKLKVTLATPPE